MTYVAAVNARAKAFASASKLDKLEFVRGKASELEGCRNKFQRMTSTRDMLNRFAPMTKIEALLRTLNTNLMDTEEELERVEDDIRFLEVEHETAMADSEKAAAMVVDAEKMKVANIRIRNMLPRYERAEELRKSVARTGAKLEILNAFAKEMANRLERSSARIFDIGGKLKDSPDIDSRICIEEMIVEGVEIELSRLSVNRARGSVCLKAEDVVKRLENSFALHDAQARVIAAEWRRVSHCSSGSRPG